MPTYTVPDGRIVPGVFVNPGSGTVRHGTVTMAARNMRALLKDAGQEQARVYRCPRQDEGGRHAFSVKTRGARHVVLMPGWPLKKVRFTGSPQNPWDFPRLFVDDSSWLWKYAAEILGEEP